MPARAVAAGTWPLVRRDFERGVALKRIAALYGVNRATVRHRAARERWIEPTDEQRAECLKEADRARASSDRRRVSKKPPVVTVVAGSAVAGEEKLPPPPGSREELIAVHRAELFDVKSTLLRDAMRTSRDQKAAIQVKSAHWELYRKAVQAVTEMQETERRAYGFDYKMQQESKTQDVEAAAKKQAMIADILRLSEEIGRRTDPVPKEEGTAM